MKPHKISTHLAYSDNCYFHLFLSVVWLSWNFARFHEIQFQTELESFNKKVLYLKKNLSRWQYQNKKSFVYWLNFPEGFALPHYVPTFWSTINIGSDKKQKARHFYATLKDAFEIVFKMHHICQLWKCLIRLFNI